MCFVQGRMLNAECRTLSKKNYPTYNMRLWYRKWRMQNHIAYKDQRLCFKHMHHSTMINILQYRYKIEYGSAFLPFQHPCREPAPKYWWQPMKCLVSKRVAHVQDPVTSAGEESTWSTLVSVLSYSERRSMNSFNNRWTFLFDAMAGRISSLRSLRFFIPWRVLRKMRLYKQAVTKKDLRIHNT